MPTSLAMRTLALRERRPCGANRTEITQVSFGPSLVPAQLLAVPITKFRAAVRERATIRVPKMFSGPLPLLVTAIVRGELSVPSCCERKLRPVAGLIWISDSETTPCRPAVRVPTSVSMLSVASAGSVPAGL